MNARPRFLLVASAVPALVLLAGGCNDIDLPKSWAIAYPRVLAMRSEVIGDEARATPEPGERVRLRVLIAGKEPTPRLSYALLLCPALASHGELPACADEPFAMEQGELGGATPFADELVVELELPDADALDGVDQLLVIGTACSEGDARLPKNERDPGECKGSAEPAMTWTGTLELARSEDDYNHNPVIADDAIAFGKLDWSPPVDADGNEQEPLSVAADGEAHVIRVNLSASGRERQGDEPEALLLSHFVTGGKLARRFSVLEPDDPDDRVLEVEWHSPHLPAGEDPPEHVRAVFVLRDQRGGVAFTIRELAIRK